MQLPDHVRTVAFAVKREVATRLQFPEPLVSKRDCLDFEMGLRDQVLALGYQVAVVGPDQPCVLNNDYLWDTDLYSGREEIFWTQYRQQFRRVTWAHRLFFLLFSPSTLAFLAHPLRFHRFAMAGLLQRALTHWRQSHWGRGIRRD